MDHLTAAIIIKMSIFMTQKLLEKHLHMYKNAHCSTAGNNNGKKSHNCNQHVHSMECYSWGTQPYTALKDMQFEWFGKGRVAQVTICVKAYTVILDIFYGYLSVYINA